MEFEKILNPVIDPNAVVTVTDMGHLKEVQYLERKNAKATICKVDKDHYCKLSTGEVKEFSHIENRKESFNSLRQTFKKLRYLINANFKGLPNELHVTLTYAENMTDTKRLYSDFKKFYQRLKRKFKNTSIDYINVIEPQGRGAWHCHVLLRFNDLSKIYIDNGDLSDMWGNGFVVIKSLKGVDNIGAYLSAYLSDLDISDNADVSCVGDVVDKVVVDDTGQTVSKKVLKGGRLHLYPPGMNLYRKSKGIVEPSRFEMNYGVFRKKIGGSANPHYSSGFVLSDDDNAFQNTIIYEQYNLKRQ